MNRRIALSRIAGLTVAAAGVATTVNGAPDTASREISVAERRMFVDDQLRSLPPTATLEYTLTKRGSLEPGFEDHAIIRVGAPRASGGRPVHMDVRSQAPDAAMPDLEAATGNPIILFFLERDVREMHRLTGGSPNHFRQRIRLALASHAEVVPVAVTAGTRQVSAVEIRIAPYRDDPVRTRYERFAEKSYAFTLSNDVPGEVVEMRSEVLAPDAASRDAPGILIAEELRFARMRSGE
ncbi:MAG TPA: hypothetical protein VFQ93_14115 [Casimicrobiaceae bacterium]|jgi:hypothetical protein|nr:hypothetical protein [Casimicrobiaceae bacterium]